VSSCIPAGGSILCNTTTGVNYCKPPPVCNAGIGNYTASCRGRSGTFTQAGALTCPSQCTDVSCVSFPTCAAGEYVDMRNRTDSGSTFVADSYSCASPGTGASSMSCASGNFLYQVPTLKSSAVNFMCLPCPTGWNCSGGVGAAAVQTLPGSGSCPSAPSSTAILASGTSLPGGVFYMSGGAVAVMPQWRVSSMSGFGLCVLYDASYYMNSVSGGVTRTYSTGAY
jgi:hypothetical protein